MSSIPVSYATSTGAGDFWVAVLAILAFAIAVTVALVVASPAHNATSGAAQRPTIRQAPTTTFSKAG
ncbi:MAG TPA: hypothetical protein VLU92_07795 [Candidatus Dormibacteraeota bacterium]|nr:hypothetical protein [Candidatus Dormibacteraeota bacterium]